MRTLAIPALLLLGACQSTQPGVRVETVRVPVPGPCLARDAIPPEPEQVGDRLTGQAAADLSIVAESALKLRAWGRTLYSAMVACAD